MLNQVSDLKEYYKGLKGYQKWFFPRALSRILDKAIDPNPEISNSVSNLDIIEVAFDTRWFTGSVWFFHKFFYSGLNTFFNTPAVEPCKWLLTHNLLTDRVIEHNQSDVIAKLIQDLYIAVESQNAAELRAKMIELEVFTRNHDLGEQSIHIQSFALNLVGLNKVGILLSNDGLAHFKACLKIDDQRSFLNAIQLLDASSLLNQVNVNSLLASNGIASVAIALDIVHRGGVLDPDVAQVYFDAIVNHQTPGGISEGVRILEEDGLLCIENMQAIAGHLNPSGVAQCLVKMNALGLLEGDEGQRNRQALLRQKDPQYIASILDKLQGLAEAQDTFNSLMRYSYILCGDEQKSHWDLAFLNLTRWIEMLKICVFHETSPDTGIVAWIEYAKTIRHNARKISQEALSGGVVHLAIVLNGIEPSLLKKDPEGFARIIVLLESVGLLSKVQTVEGNLKAVLTKPRMIEVESIIRLLIDVQLLSGDLAQDNFSKVMKRTFLSDLLNLLTLMRTIGLLGIDCAQTNLNELLKINNLTLSLDILTWMHSYHLLQEINAQAYFITVLEHENQNKLMSILHRMSPFYVSLEHVSALLRREELDAFEAALITLEQYREHYTVNAEQAQKIFSVMVEHQYPSEALAALVLLTVEGMLNQSIDAEAYLAAMRATPDVNPTQMASALVMLYRNQLLSPNIEAISNRQSVCGHAYPMVVSQALIELNNKGLLYPNPDSNVYRQMVVASDQPRAMASALIVLNDHELSSEGYRDALRLHKSPKALAESMVTLNTADLLDAMTLGVLAASEDPKGRAKNIIALARDNKFDKVFAMLSYMARVSLLNDDNIEEYFLFLCSYADVLCQDEVLRFFDREATAQIWDDVYLNPDKVATIGACEIYIQNVRAAHQAQARAVLADVVGSIARNGVFAHDARVEEEERERLEPAGDHPEI